MRNRALALLLLCACGLLAQEAPKSDFKHGNAAYLTMSMVENTLFGKAGSWCSTSGYGPRSNGSTWDCDPIPATDENMTITGNWIFANANSHTVTVDYTGSTHNTKVQTWEQGTGPGGPYEISNLFYVDVGGAPTSLFKTFRLMQRKDQEDLGFTLASEWDYAAPTLATGGIHLALHDSTADLDAGFSDMARLYNCPAPTCAVNTTFMDFPTYPGIIHNLRDWSAADMDGTEAVNYDSMTLANVTTRGATSADSITLTGGTPLTLGEDKTTPTSNTKGWLKFWSNGDNNYDTVIQAGTQTQAKIIYTMPQDDGAAGTCLQSDGSGTLSWAACGGSTPTLAQAATTGGFAGTENIVPGYLKQAKHFNADDPPTVSNAASDEFDDAVFSVAKWSWHDGGAPSTVDESTYPGYLILSNTADSTDFMQQTVNYTGAFTIEAGFRDLFTGLAGAENGAAVWIFALDTNGTGHAFGMTSTTASTPVVLPSKSTITTWGAPTVGGTTFGWVYWFGNSNARLKISRDVSDNVCLYVSEDGIAWRMQDGACYTNTEDIIYVGVYLTFKDGGGAGHNSVVALDYFRATTP